MESGTLPPPTMLLYSNDSFQQMSSAHSPMNQYSDLFSSKQSVQTNTKTTKRKYDDLVDPSSADFDSSGSSLKPQKLEQQNVDSERSISRTETSLSNGPLSHSCRNGNDNGPPSYDFGTTNNNGNTGRATPNASLLSHRTPPPPSLQQQQQQQQQHSLPPPPPSSYMPMSPRNQYTVTSDSPFLQANNQVFVFTTQLANEAAEFVLKNEYPNIIEYHKTLPSTTQYLSSLSNNMNHNHHSLLGGLMHTNHGPPHPPGCHSPRTMQMMMGGPPHHNPHLQYHNGGGGGPPPNWPHPHFHPHQQQPPFGRLTPGSGGLPPPSHLLPPGAHMMDGSSPPPGMRMGGMPPMSGMGQPPLDGTENLTPERAKHRKTQLNKIEDLKTKITGGRTRGGRAKANAAAAAAATGNIPSPVNGGPPPPGSLDPHQQQMMMMNSSRGVGPPHHMMGIGPPPHMLPPGMRGPPDEMMMEMNGPPPHGYMNGPMPPGFHGQYGPGPGDPYGQLPPPHQHSQAMRDWNRMQIDHFEGRAQQMRGQPPPYSSTSPSSLTPPIATTSTGGGLGSNGNMNSGKLLSPKMEPSSAPRLYKVGQPEKFILDSLPSSANKKVIGNAGEVQMTASPTQMDYEDIGVEGEELIISRHLNQAFRSTNSTNAGGLPSSSSSSSCKDEPMTPSTRSTSTPNNLTNPLSSGKPPVGSTTPTHISQGPSSHLTPQSVSAASPRPAKLAANSSLSSPLMLSNTNSSAKDEPLDMNGGPRTPISNMAPPLSSMLQMANSLQSANSPYNPSNNSSASTGLKPSSNLASNGPPMTSPNLAHMAKSIDQLPPQSHMSLSPHQQQLMQFQNMNPHHRMLGPPESMPPHYHPHHGGNLMPPGHPHMYKMRPPHHTLDPSAMMMSNPGGSMRSSKGLPPLSSDPMQQHLHHLPPSQYAKMSNMDPLLGPPLGHQQQHMRFAPMMDDGFGMEGPPHPSHHPHHPHMHPHMHPHLQMHHQQMHPNDGRLQPPPQSINNTYVSATMSIQQLNIQNLGPGGPASDIQPGTIHYHASSGNGLDCSQQQGPPGSNSNSPMFSSQQQQQQQYTTMNHIPSNDQSYAPQFNDLQPLPSHLNMDGAQSTSYW